MQSQTDAISNWALKSPNQTSSETVEKPFPDIVTFWIQLLDSDTRRWIVTRLIDVFLWSMFAKLRHVRHVSSKHVLHNLQLQLSAWPGSQTGCRQVRQIWPGSTGWRQGQGKNLHGYLWSMHYSLVCTTWLTSTHRQKCMHWHCIHCIMFI